MLDKPMNKLKGKSFYCSLTSLTTMSRKADGLDGKEKSSDRRCRPVCVGGPLEREVVCKRKGYANIVDTNIDGVFVEEGRLADFFNIGQFNIESFKDILCLFLELSKSCLAFVLPLQNLCL
jgi:hypothetical protein